MGFWLDPEMELRVMLGLDFIQSDKKGVGVKLIKNKKDLIAFFKGELDIRRYESDPPVLGYKVHLHKIFIHDCGWYFVHINRFSWDSKA